MQPEANKVVDLLPHLTAATLAVWSGEHPRGSRLSVETGEVPARRPNEELFHVSDKWLIDGVSCAISARLYEPLWKRDTVHSAKLAVIAFSLPHQLRVLALDTFCTEFPPNTSFFQIISMWKHKETVNLTITTGDRVRLIQGVPRSGLVRGATGIVLTVLEREAMVLFTGKLVRLSLKHLTRTTPIAKMYGA